MTAVVVHDVDKLEDFGKYLDGKREEIGDICKEMERECRGRKDNWQDERYYKLKDELKDFTDSCDNLLEKLKDEADYIQRLVDKLRDM